MTDVDMEEWVELEKIISQDTSLLHALHNILTDVSNDDFPTESDLDIWFSELSQCYMETPREKNQTKKKNAFEQSRYWKYESSERMRNPVVKLAY
jgi:hypothetical protein